MNITESQQSTPQSGFQTPEVHLDITTPIPDAPLQALASAALQSAQLPLAQNLFGNLGDAQLEELLASSEDEAQPAPFLRFASDSDSDEMSTPTTDDILFIKGSATKGDVVAFSDKMLRYLRGGRATEYDLARQAQVWSSKCDQVTYDSIQACIAANRYTVRAAGGVGVGDVEYYFTADLAAAAAGGDAAAVPIVRGTLETFAAYFKREFARMDASKEAKKMIEVSFGQSQALEHHNAEFNRYLGMLPGGLDLSVPMHIDHWLASLSPALPKEL